MSEKEIEDRLVDRLCEANASPSRLAGIRYISIDSEEKSFAELCGSFSYEIFPNDANWNTHKDIMDDLIGGMTPDIVLRSAKTHENRIYIEVKDSNTCFRYDTEDSQIIRYFLHLIAVSKDNKKDIQRAIIIAAPEVWFNNSRTVTDWEYFVNHYGGLARKFNISLGELHVDA